MDDAVAVVVIGIGDAAKHHRAKAVGADLDAGSSQWTVFYGVLLLFIASWLTLSGCGNVLSGTAFRIYTEQRSACQVRAR